MNEFFPEDYPDFQEFGEPPCATSYPDAFFQEDALDSAMVKRGIYLMEREAKATCFGCDYRQRCLEYALKNPELQGIWGGTNENQRKMLRKGINIRIGLPPNRNR